MKKILVGLLLAWISLSSANGKKTGKSALIVADTVIYDGWVILHGRLLAKPYHLHLECDTLWVNGMQYLPPPPDPLQKPPEWTAEWTELGKWYFVTNEIFLDSCRIKYKRWRCKEGAAKAMDRLLHYINTQKLIKIKSVESSTDAVTVIYGYRQLDLIKNPTPKLIEEFSKPEHEYIKIGVMLWGETDEDTTRISATQGEIFLHEYNSIKGSLIQGLFLYLSYSGYEEYGMVKGHEPEFINLIKEILAQPISENEMIKELHEKADLDSLESTQVIYNKNFWFDDGVKNE